MRNANGRASRTRAAVNAFAMVQTVFRMTSDHISNGLDMTLDTRYRPLERRTPRESPRAPAAGRARRLRTEHSSTPGVGPAVATRRCAGAALRDARPDRHAGCRHPLRESPPGRRRGRYHPLLLRAR